MRELLSYHNGRLGKSIQLTYRLKRRTYEIIKILKEYPSLNRILDIGTADGLMLSRIKSKFNDKQCFGIDISYDLLKTNTNTNIKLLQSDALCLPFKDGVFDIVLAIAVIEHLTIAIDLLKESYRLLREGGLIIVTTPVPFWIRIASDLRLFKDDDHKTFFSLNHLKNILQQVGFEIIKLEKFMIFPIGLPFESKIEWFMKKIKLDLLFINQLIVGKKKESKCAF